MCNNVRKCVGCGFCCISSACALEMYLYGNQEQCPDLQWDKEQNRYVCNLVVIGHKNVEWLFIGAGCCSGLNTWRNNVQKRREIDG